MVCYPKTDYISIIRLVRCHPTGHILVGMLPCFQIPFLVSVCQADTKILYLLIGHIVFLSWFLPHKFRVIGLFSIIPVNCKLRNPSFLPCSTLLLLGGPLTELLPVRLQPENYRLPFTAHRPRLGHSSGARRVGPCSSQVGRPPRYVF